MLGREVLLLAHLIAKPPEESVGVTVSFVENFQSDMRDAHERVRQATHAAAKTQKIHFDKLVKGPVFAVNQLVWLYWPRPFLRTQLRKLQRFWTGPFRILEFKTQVVVVIQHVQTLKKQTVHIDRLTLCMSSVSTHVTPNTDAPNGTDQSTSQVDPQSPNFARGADTATALPKGDYEVSTV